MATTATFDNLWSHVLDGSTERVRSLSLPKEIRRDDN